METIMSNIKTYILLLALGFIVGACGGGSGSGSGSGGGSTSTLNLAQRNLLNNVYELLTPPSPGEVSAPPIVARNDPSSMNEIREVTGNSDSLSGKYYIIFSSLQYKIIESDEQRNKFTNPTLEPDSGHADLEKTGIELDITQGDSEETGVINIDMLFNDAGNAVIAISDLGDFLAGGKPIVNLPSGEFDYSGVNYYRETNNPSTIVERDFNLSVNFDTESGTFESGLRGEITLDGRTGNYSGVQLSLDNSDHDDISIKGKFHGNDDGNSVNSSVTGLYLGGPTSDPTIFGAIIGTQTQTQN